VAEVFMSRAHARLLASVLAISTASVVGCASAEAPAAEPSSSSSLSPSPPPPPAPAGGDAPRAVEEATADAAGPTTAARAPAPEPAATRESARRDAIAVAKQAAQAAAAGRTKNEAESKAMPHAVGKKDKALMPSDDDRVAPADQGGTFVHAGTNPFIETASDALSTFAVDVDTGSFTFARRYLKQGDLPPDAAVRVEEWVNAMHYSYAAPPKAQAVPFAIHVAGAPSPIARGKHLVRVALQGKQVTTAERGPTHLVFLVDVSGSMEAHDKLPLAKDAMHKMVDGLRADDSIALVTYAGSTGVVLPTTSLREKARIHAAIDRLSSGGGTNMGSGMELAYREAAKQLGGGRSARVVVLSDGDANIGRTSHQAILSSVKGYVSEGVMMSTVGFGTGNYNDHLMEQLANAGNGAYTYIDSAKTAERFFVHELNGTLETIAQDVKIQVEWNSDVVSRYRLVGYENRDIADVDFRNDKKDAGEIGAGHAVTALYEVELTSTSPSGPLGTVRVRAKQPRGSRADEHSVAITPSVIQDRPGDLDDDARAAAAVALAAEVLRRSPYAEGRTLSEAAALLREAATGPHAAERLELARDLLRVEPRLAAR
jgi:Ca-activated chloride channel homolog